MRDIKPTEVYNLAAQSHVQVSFQMPMFTAEVDGVGVLNIMEAIRFDQANDGVQVLPSVDVRVVR